jgi:hypothetical protein
MYVCVCMCLSSKISIETHNLSFLKTFQKMSSFCPCQMLLMLGSLLFISLYVCRRRNIYIYIGCRAILYSLLLRTAPSHLQLLYVSVCCCKIVICVCDRERRSARALFHTSTMRTGQSKKKRIYIFLFSILHIVRSDGAYD